MKLLNRYLAASFFRNFALAAAALLGLFLLITIFESLRTLLRYDATFKDSVMMIASQIPWMAVQIIPISCLIGTMATLSIMAKDGEITALRASGIPIRRLAWPIMLCGLSLSVFCYLIQERVVPAAYSYSREVKNIKIKGMTAKNIARSTDVWLRMGDAIVHAQFISPDRREMKGLQVFELEKGKVARQMNAKGASWSGDKWTMADVSVKTIDAGQGWKSEQLPALDYPVAPMPEEIYVSRDLPAELSMADLGKSIESQRAQGLSVNDLLVDYWSKTSAPFASLIMALVAVPFAARVSKRAGLWGGISKGIGIGLCFYLIQMFGISFGRTGNIPPMLAAWLGNLVFALLCVRLLIRSESA
jgi:lipopolysaccharide export system permease protein